MKAFAVVLACFALQDGEMEGAVARLVEALSDDDVQARDKAGRDLAALGPKALPAIRRRLETGEVEVRERLQIVVREIERLDRLRFFLGGESRITLKADRWPIGKVLAELARQNPTPVLLKEVPETEPVAFEIRNASFFDALGQICRAHGGLVFRLPSGTFRVEDHTPVELVRGNPLACPAFVEGPFVVTLDSIYVAESSDFRGKRDSNVNLNVGVGWERGTRPIGMRLTVTSVVDEQDKRYKVVSTDSREDRMDPFIWRRIWMDLDPPLPASVTTFREITGVVEFRFPSDGHVARIEDPLGKKGIEASGGAAAFTLQECVRDGGDSVRVLAEAAWPEGQSHAERIQFFALDGRDRIYPQQGGQGRSTTPGRMRWTFGFEIPESETVKEIRAITLRREKGRMIERKIEWKLENVRFR